MRMLWRSVLYQLVIWLSISLANGHLWLYMPKEETYKLLGIDAEVNYIIKGHPMSAAVAAPLMINTSYNQHILYWKTGNTDRQISYTIGFATDYHDGLELPIKLNITSTGFIPTELAAMQMTFNCTGRRPVVQIDVKFSIRNLAGGNDVINITLKRKKICGVTESSTRPHQVVINKNMKNISQYTFEDKNPQVLAGQLATPLSNIHAKPTSTEIFYVAVAVASAVIIMVAIIIFTLYIRTRRRTTISNDRPSVIGSSNHGSSFLRLDGNKNSSLMSLPSSRRGTLSSFSVPASAHDIQITLGSLAINRKSVNLGDILLEGAFGKVHHGIVYVQDETEECYEQKVFIKSASDEASDQQIRNLLLEGAMLKGLNHQYINPLIAVCLDKPPLLIYPHTDKGNLKLLLNQSNRISTHSPCLNTQRLVSMAMQVAKGLHYLHRKHIIHKDIAARNCCVDSNFNVKITDYALSRDLFPDDYVCLGDNENRPVKWMAIESLVERRYSYATDTWSFGVLLWELITFSQQPYCDVDAFEISSYLQSGYRLLQPINCPDELFAVMAYCWAMQPTDRPSLTQILACLQEFHKTLSCFV